MLTAETQATTENPKLFWRLKCARHNRISARARAVEWGVTSLIPEVILQKTPPCEQSLGTKHMYRKLKGSACRVKKRKKRKETMAADAEDPKVLLSIWHESLVRFHRQHSYEPV